MVNPPGFTFGSSAVPGPAPFGSTASSASMVNPPGFTFGSSAVPGPAPFGSTASSASMVNPPGFTFGSSAVPGPAPFGSTASSASVVTPQGSVFSFKAEDYNASVAFDINSEDLLTARFSLIMQFNIELAKALSLNMIDLSQIDESGSIANSLGASRRYILPCVKNNIIEAGMTSTEVSGFEFNLNLSRLQALNHAGKGKCDNNGRWSVFGQAFRSIHGLPPSSLRSKSRLWRVEFIGEHSIDGGGPYRDSWANMCQVCLNDNTNKHIPCFQLTYAMSYCRNLCRRRCHYSNLVLTPRSWWVLTAILGC